MGFLHEHKLSLENDFQAVLKGGKTCTSYPLRFLYVLEKSEIASFQVAISVPKKKFHHAVDRNLVKRRIREGIRHIYPCVDFKGLSLKLLVVYCDEDFRTQQNLEQIIEQNLRKILKDAKNS